MAIWGMVPAAGVGKRFGSALPKQYLELNGKTVAENALERLLAVPELTQVVVALSREDSHFKQLKIANDSRIKTVMGGDERCHSVLNGLRYLSNIGDPLDWVLVHDVARPCVRESDVRKLIEQVNQFDVVGGILAAPVRDTMKRGNRINQIEATVDRNQLWHALTPQLFRLGSLQEAIESALQENILVTDESAAMERLGHQPLLVEGHYDNIKITHPQDLALAELFLRQR